MRFTAPVYADLLTGEVFSLTDSLKAVPLYDAPILIAERSALLLNTK